MPPAFRSLLFPMAASLLFVGCQPAQPAGPPAAVQVTPAAAASPSGASGAATVAPATVAQAPPTEPPDSPCGQVLAGKPLPARPPLHVGGLRPIIVQIDNAADARPPLHLTGADVVYEYVAEGGVTRFSALFTKEDPGQIGPVRSARIASLEIARQYDAILTYDGASTGVQDLIWNGGIDFVSFNSAETKRLGIRLPGRVPPHDEVTTLPSVRDYAASRGWAVSGASWPDFARGEAPPSSLGTPTTDLSIGFSGPDGAPWPDYRADFHYVPDQKRYVRAIGGKPHLDGAGGEPVSAETVIVQVAPVVVTDIVEDIYGSKSLDYQVQGEGPAYFLRDGLRWQGCWKRSGAFESTLYVGPDGKPFPAASGPVWVSLATPQTPLEWRA